MDFMIIRLFHFYFLQMMFGMNSKEKLPVHVFHKSTQSTRYTYFTQKDTLHMFIQEYMSSWALRQRMVNRVANANFRRLKNKIFYSKSGNVHRLSQQTAT